MPCAGVHTFFDGKGSTVTRTPAGRGRTGRPPVTSRAEILAAARRIIDRDGATGLTLRGLAAELGIGTATLYRHVRDREDLLVQLLDELAGQIDLPAAADSPRDRILAAATAVHDALASWPWAAEVLTVDGFLGRLGLCALRPVETIVAAAVAAGRSEQQAVELFRHVWYYTVGEILVRACSRQRPLGAAPGPFLAVGEEALSQVPTLAAVGDRWLEYEARDTYREGLAALVDGLLAAGGGRRGVG